jgi:KDO2-lipid IV(A) lauroyltransferase
LKARVNAWLQYRTWQVASALVGKLGPRASYRVAWLIGSLTYYAWPRARRAMHRNYRRVLGDVPPRVIRSTARRSLVNYCCYLADFVRFPALSKDEVSEAVLGEPSFAALDRELERGCGAVIVCMHFGNWDVGAGAAAARGYPLTVVAETFPEPRLDAMVLDSRERLGMHILKMEKAGPSLLRVLKRNGLLALLIDRPTSGDGVKVMFFGEEVEVPAGPARLALRAGASVVPTAFARVNPRAPEVTTLTEFGLCVTPSGDEDTDVKTLTQAIMRAHESFIRRYPDQWYMFREMWPEPRATRVK